MLPERNDVISEEDEEEEDEDEFQMLERLTREIDGLAAPTMTLSREYSSPLRESIKAFVGKRWSSYSARKRFKLGREWWSSEQKEYQ